MRWRDIGRTTCSVARTLAAVGDRWTLLVLRDTFLGIRRFEDFHADLGATRHRLADRLRTLVAHGVLERVPYQRRPPRFEYRLTEKGRDLYPVIVSPTRWGGPLGRGHGWPAGRARAPKLRPNDHANARLSRMRRAPVVARDMMARPAPALAKAWRRRPGITRAKENA
jgi:DNA-binding HxlR family transcriptional regulator